ncbi:MAG TPA: gliding motility-associated C-terminal domain-containing protein, partial [Bacteroidia bacterium]|nr:gliding motility-associated C-terminal domain-containing protein [Bacteroidia bacterium]
MNSILTASMAAGTGTWIPVGVSPNVASPNSTTTAVSFTNQGTFTYVWSVTFATCPSEQDTIVVTTYSNPSVSNAGIDQTLCTYTGTLVGNTPSIGTGTWIPLGAAPAVTSSLSPTSSVNFSGAGTYTYVWSIGNGNCPANNDTININVYSVPSIANAGPDQSVCSYTTNMAAVLPAIGIGTWTPLSIPNSTVSIINSNNSGVAVNSQGLFGFVWTVGNSSVCPTTSDTMFVQAYTPILPGSANAGPDITTDLLNNLMAGNTPTVGAGTWSILTGPGGSFANTADPLSNFTANEAGTYELVWTLTNGVCAAVSDTMVLIINPLLIPQVITPNGDGSNDFFEVRGLADVNDVKLFVFNRWGNQVYHHENYKDSFKGENNDGVKL